MKSYPLTLRPEKLFLKHTCGSYFEVNVLNFLQFQSFRLIYFLMREKTIRISFNLIKF